MNTSEYLELGNEISPFVFVEYKIKILLSAILRLITDSHNIIVSDLTWSTLRIVNKDKGNDFFTIEISYGRMNKELVPNIKMKGQGEELLTIVNKITKIIAKGGILHQFFDILK